MRIDVEDLTYAIGGQTILDRVALSVPDGSRAAVVGPSGSGKSSLIRVIAGLARPSAGRVALDGRVVTGRPGVPAHRRGVAYVPQDGALFPHLSAARNIVFGLPRARRDEAPEWAELVALDPALLSRHPHELSGGQQQRVALARALAVGARAIVLDEPFSALDAGVRVEARRNVVDALARVRATAVLVTHDHDEALGFGDRLGVIEAGRLTQFGTPMEVFDFPGSPRIAAMLGPVTCLDAVSDGRTASTAFGPVPLRHAPDRRSPPPGRVSVLLRDGQLVVTDGPANATVLRLDTEGHWQRVVLRPRCGEGPPVTARVLRSGRAPLASGGEVRIGIEGSGYALPPDAPRAVPSTCGAATERPR